MDLFYENFYEEGGPGFGYLSLIKIKNTKKVQMKDVVNIVDTLHKCRLARPQLSFHEYVFLNQNKYSSIADLKSQYYTSIDKLIIMRYNPNMISKILRENGLDGYDKI